MSWIRLPAAIIALTAVGADRGRLARRRGHGVGGLRRAALATLDRQLQRARLTPADAPVRQAPVRRLPCLDSALRLAAELAVDGQRHAPVGQELLQRADVGAPHRLRQRTRAEAALRRGLGYRYCYAHGGRGHGEHSTA